MGETVKADLWERLKLIEDGMSRVRAFADAQRWKEAQETLRRQEQACRRFACLLSEQPRSSASPDEMTQRYRQTLESLQCLVAELRESFEQRREELLKSLARLNEKERVAKEYGGSQVALNGATSPAGKARVAGGQGGFKPNGLSGTWSPRRLALYS